MSVTVLVFLFLNQQVQYADLAGDGTPVAVYADSASQGQPSPAEAEFTAMLDKTVPESSAGNVRVCAVVPDFSFSSSLQGKLFDRLGKIDDALHGNFDIWEDAGTLKNFLHLDASHAVTFADAFAYCKAVAPKALGAG